MSKKYINSILEFKESNIDLWGLFSLNGFRQEAILLKKENKGSTTYTFRKKIQMSFDIITTLTSKPLEAIFYIGLFLFLSSLLFILYVIIKYFNEDMSNAIGWASVIASIWFFGGLIILLLGTLSIYISKIFVEVKERPKYIIKKTYKVNDGSN